MKRGVHILFLVLILGSLFGAYPMLRMMQLYAKEEMKLTISSGRIPANTPEYIIADTTSVQWEDDAAEFIKDGEWYDVKEITVVNGHRYFHCIKDRKETNAFDNIERFIHGIATNDSGEKSAVRLLKAIFSLVYISPQLPCFNHALIYRCVLWDAPYHFTVSASYYRPPLPPPRHSYSGL